MKLDPRIMLLLNSYPYLFVLGFFFFKWRKRAEKLEELEIVKKNIIYSVSATRILALYLWATLEIIASVYMFFIYLGSAQFGIPYLCVIQRLLIFVNLSSMIKGLFVGYGGYVLQLELQRKVPSLHLGTKILWIFTLVYDVFFLLWLSLEEKENYVQGS
jgi:hypothetical protein